MNRPPGRSGRRRTGTRRAPASAIAARSSRGRAGTTPPRRSAPRAPGSRRTHRLSGPEPSISTSAIGVVICSPYRSSRCASPPPSGRETGPQRRVLVQILVKRPRRRVEHLHGPVLVRKKPCPRLTAPVPRCANRVISARIVVDEVAHARGQGSRLPTSPRVSGGARDRPARSVESSMRERPWKRSVLQDPEEGRGPSPRSRSAASRSSRSSDARPRLESEVLQQETATRTRCSRSARSGGRRRARRAAAGSFRPARARRGPTRRGARRRAAPCARGRSSRRMLDGLDLDRLASLQQLGVASARPERPRRPSERLMTTNPGPRFGRPALAHLRQRWPSRSAPPGARCAALSPARTALQEPIMTMRGGRYVVPVRAKAQARCGDRPRPVGERGHRLIEPMAIVEQNNRLRQLEADARGDQRLLRAASEDVGGTERRSRLGRGAR